MKTGATRKKNRTRGDDRQDAMVAVLMQFRVVLRSIRKHYRSVERTCGVSGAQLWALVHIGADPGLKVTDLANAISIHQTTASNIVDKLVDDKLVNRRRVSDDRRVIRLFLTPKGERVLHRAPRPLRGVLQEALLDLSPATLRALHRHLAELVRHLQFRDAGDMSEPLPDAMANRKPVSARRAQASATPKAKPAQSK